MSKALKKTIMYFWYEIIILGVIYDGLIVFRVMSKNINGMMILVFLLVLFFGQLAYFYYKR